MRQVVDQHGIRGAKHVTLGGTWLAASALVLIVHVTAAAQSSKGSPAVVSTAPQASPTVSAPAAGSQPPVTVNVTPPPVTINERPIEFREWFPNVVIAFFTVMSVAVAGAQWHIGKQQAAIAARQTDVLAFQSALTFPPKIIVREIEVPKAMHLHERAISRAEEGDTKAIARDVVGRAERSEPLGLTELSGSFRITNKGGSEARTQIIEAELWVGRTLPQRYPVKGSAPTAQDRTLPAGSSDRLTMWSIQINEDQRADIVSKRADLFALGRIVYTDKLGNGRRTGFARRLNVRSGRFEIVKDEPDYEYVD